MDLHKHLKYTRILHKSDNFFGTLILFLEDAERMMIKSSSVLVNKVDKLQVFG